MTRFNILFTIIPLLFITYWYTSIVHLHTNEVEALNTYMLSLQVNNAADAAVEELRMYSENTDIDYMTASINVDPTAAVNEFESMMCNNLQLPITRDTMDFVANNYIKILLICIDNGFYTYMNQGVNSTKKAFISYPMLPYTGHLNLYDPADEGIIDDSEDKLYAMTIPCDKLYECTYAENEAGAISVQAVTTVKNGAEVYVPSPSVKQQMRDSINDSVEYFLRSAIYETYSSSEPSTVIMPSGVDTIHGGQGIDGPTVFAVVDTTHENRNPYKAAFGVGGSSVIKNDPIVAWIEPASDSQPYARKYWAWQSQLEDRGWMDKDGDGNYKDPEHAQMLQNAVIFSTPFEAAEHGYNQSWEVSAYHAKD